MTLWINGDWVTGLGERRVKTNPVSGDVLWHGNDADAMQVTQACQAARAAFAERRAIAEADAAQLAAASRWQRTLVIDRAESGPESLLWVLARSEALALIEDAEMAVWPARAWQLQLGWQPV